jgi:glycosyltransferase involved in cell wall biosynthesis
MDDHSDLQLGSAGQYSPSTNPPKPVLNRRIPMKKKKKIALLSEAWNGFGYPYVTDTAELLSQSGFDVSVVIPYRDDVEMWNSGRGFAFEFVNMRIGLSKTERNSAFLARAFATVLRADAVIAFTHPTLLLGIIANMLGKKVLYYPMELIISGTEHGGAFSYLQNFLKYTSIKVATTGRHRSRLLAIASGLKNTPDELPLTPLRATSAVRNFHGPTIAHQIRETASAPDAIVVLCNGSLHAVNCLDLILDASIPANSGVLIGMIGRMNAEWSEKVAAAHAKTGNYFYFGEVPGTRYDAIAAVKQADLGLVLKHWDSKQTYNDRLYTPCKLAEFVAAGVPVLCSGQPSLNFARREGIGYCLPDLSEGTLRNFLLSLPSRRAELLRMSQTAQELFATRYNCETTARGLVDYLR